MGERHRIVETQVEGQSSQQQGRGAFETWVGTGPAYWKRIIVREEDRVPVMNREGELVSDLARVGAKAYHIVSPATTGSISVRNAYYEYPPGTRSSLHWHNAEESYYVVDGTGYIEVEGERHDFEEGDGVFVPLRQKHRLVNTGNVPLKLVQVTSMMLRPADDLAATPVDYREFREEV